VNVNQRRWGWLSRQRIAIGTCSNWPFDNPGTKCSSRRQTSGKQPKGTDNSGLAGIVWSNENIHRPWFKGEVTQALEILEVDAGQSDAGFVR
jgi:hypothetical protein